MRQLCTALGMMVMLLVAGCAPPDPHVSPNVQSETGHVDSGGGGGGGGGSM